jgi:hypothetical protein
MPISPRDAARIVQIVERAAAAEPDLSLLLVVELHGQADDLVPVAREEPRATDESTPPLMATTMRMSEVTFLTSERSFDDDGRQLREQCVDLLLVLPAPRLKRIEFCVRCDGRPMAPQYVRGLERARRAGRPGRHREPFEVQRDQQRLRFDAVEADVRRVRHARATARR